MGQVQLEKICCLRARAQRVSGHCGDPEATLGHARRREAAREGVGGVQDSRGSRGTVMTEQAQTQSDPSPPRACSNTSPGSSNRLTFQEMPAIK